MPLTAGDGIVVVDKPSGCTSHDVVARVRRMARTRRVGHAGTLDPMATGVLVLGIGTATRLLGHLSGQSKSYDATIRLGWATHTDDAAGERLAGAPAHEIAESDVLAAIGALTGPILQRPSSVSAIKVAGRRAHERVRAGEDVELPARPVVVSTFDVRDHRGDPALGVLDLDVEVACSSGTYVRALARDLGEALGVGGHLTALRRTQVGAFSLAGALTLDQLADVTQEAGQMPVTDIAVAARTAFPVVEVGAEVATDARHGRAIDLSATWALLAGTSTIGLSTADAGPTDAGPTDASPTDAGPTDRVEPHALLDPAGVLIALVTPAPDGATRYLAVFASP